MVAEVEGINEAINNGSVMGEGVNEVVNISIVLNDAGKGEHVVHRRIFSTYRDVVISPTIKKLANKKNRTSKEEKRQGSSHWTTIGC